MMVDKWGAVMADHLVDSMAAWSVELMAARTADLRDDWMVDRSVE